MARALPYRIDFENDPTATAPAQRVDIRDQLASTLDWDTFQLTEVGFGDLLLTVPAGTRHFQTTVSRTYNNHTFDVQIEIGLNSDIGQLSAAFQSIDPATNLPPDVLTGFLPPENGTGRGMGHISYTILPKANVTTGTQIRNIALVTFDLGEMIATNQVDPHDPSRGTDPNKEALVTIDAVPPTSSVARLPNTSLPNFIVSWAGSDDPGGSGLAFFDIFVSTDGGDFVPWLVHTTLTAAIFQAEVGRTYGFYSVATDNAGNREATPTSAQARTTVANAAANFSIVVNAKSVVAGQPFSITVTALDADGNVITDFAGTAHFDSSDRTPGLPDDYTFTADDAGAHTFDGVTLFRAGAQWVRAVDTDTAIGGYTIITVVPATADHFRVAAVNRVRSGMPFDITITALDPYDNVDVNYGGTVTFTSTDTDDRVVLPLDYTFTQDDAGSHTFTDTGRGETTLVTAGDQTITVSDGSLSLDILITVDSAGGGRAPRAGGSAIFVARPENAPLAFVPKREAAPIAPRRASESGDVPANARGTVFALEQQGQTVPATRARQVALLDRIFADEMTHSWPSV